MGFKTLQKFYLGAGGGGRTLMKLPSRDFESRASAIPPHQHVANFTSFRLLSNVKSLIIRLFAPYSQKRLSVFRSPDRTSLHFDFCLPIVLFFNLNKITNFALSQKFLKLQSIQNLLTAFKYYHISLYFASILPLFFIFATFFLDYFEKKSYNIIRIIYIGKTKWFLRNFLIRIRHLKRVCRKSSMFYRQLPI